MIMDNENILNTKKFQVIFFLERISGSFKCKQYELFNTNINVFSSIFKMVNL